MSQKCLTDAGITAKDLVDMFDLPVDRNLSDEQIYGELRLLGYDPDKLSPSSIESAHRNLKIQFYREQTQAMTQAKIKRSIDDYQGDPESALASLVTNDINQISGSVGVEKGMMAIVNMTHSRIHDFMNAMAPTKTGMFRGIFTGKAANRNQQKIMDDVVDEIFGANSNNPDAAKFAKSLSSALDDLNNRYQNLTGDHRTLKDWGLPQRHDPILVKKSGFENWFSKISNQLDMERMIKENPDLAEPTDFRFVMSKVYENIATDGTARIDTRPFMPGSKGEIVPNRILPRTMQSVGTKHANNRFLKFKDGKSWNAYQKEFGSGSLYQTITDHVMSVSREIALMERFGPNHKAGFSYARALVQNKTGKQNAGKMAESYYNILSNINYTEPTKTANLLRSIRDWNVATKLGGAVLSAQTDHSFAAQTALYNGLSATRMMKRYFQQLGSSNRKEAARLALTGEFALDRLSAAFEYQNAMNSGKAKALADLVMRVSGMEAHTVAMRQAFGIEFLQGLTDAADLSYTKLPERLRKAFERYGIDDAGWGSIRSSKRTTIKGVSMIDPNAVQDSRVAESLVGMILTETDFAVPTPGVRERAMVSLGTQAGTVVGEAVRGMTQFMSFPVTAQMKHMIGRSGIDKQTSAASKIGYAASLAITSTLLGAMVLQAKQLAQGKTTLNWEDEDFWLRAADQGGYFGLVGGFLMDTQGYYQGYSGGPIMDGPINDLAYTLVAGNIQKIKDGKDTTISKDATDFIIKNFPGNNIWYTRLAMERAIFDRLRSMTDPNWARTVNERMRMDMRQRNQEYWWRPNESTPEFAR
jgi:hypothetical protein